MAQEIIISFLFYYLLFIYQNPGASCFSVREGFKMDRDECPNCLENKVRRELDGFLAKGTKSKHVKNVSENFVRQSKHRNPKDGHLLLKGWGAGGMPFNVLYTPNIHQRKILKSVQQKKPEKLVKERKEMPEIYNLVLEDEKPQKNPENPPKKHLIPRKYYSLIPQLFVSYGW